MIYTVYIYIYIYIYTYTLLLVVVIIRVSIKLIFNIVYCVCLFIFNFFWPMNHAQNMNVGVRKRVCNHNCTEEQKEFRGDRHFLQTEVSNIPSFLRNPKSFHAGELTFSGCGKVSCFCLSSPAT